MFFYEKLDFLMKLTNISNSELSKRANVDPSLVSRWRRGIKTPLIFSDTVTQLALVLSQKINNDLRRKELAAQTEHSEEDLVTQDQIAAVILEWFKKDFPSNQELPKTEKLTSKRPYPSYEQRKDSQLDLHSRPEAYCFGPEGRRQALSWILSFVEYWQPGTGTLRFYTDQPFEYLDIDCSHYEKRFHEKPYAEKFRIVKILQPITATEQERLRVLQFANLFMKNSIVSISFIEQKDVSIFQHSLGIYDNQMAICSYGFYGSRYTSSYTHWDEAFVHELTNDFDVHFDSAQVALHPNSRFTLRYMHDTLSVFYSDQEDLYYTGSQIFLPLIPPDILNSCLEQASLPFLTKAQDDMQYQNFCSFLNEHRVFATFPLLSPVDFENLQSNPSLFVEKTCQISLTSEQYLEILQSVLKLFCSNDHLELSLFDMDPDMNLWSNSHRLLYAHLGDWFIPYQSEHPIFIQPLHKKQRSFFEESQKKMTREAIKEALADAICDFKEYLGIDSNS